MNEALSVCCSVSDDLFVEETRLRSELQKESDQVRQARLADYANELVKRRHDHVQICASCQKNLRGLEREEVNR
jgi:hypothetical protein